MAVSYFDSSALVKVLVQEVGSDIAADLLNGPEVVASSRLTYPEVRAAVSAARRNARLTTATEGRAVEKWDELWHQLRVIELDDEVAAGAGELAAMFDIGGADAVHLASAMTLVETDLVFVTWDRRLHDAALAAGLPVVPQQA